ncbi:MAG: glycerate kinase [Calditrichaceae bacterium]|nr:glycerate kinase [Calditrichaceae bacterium]RQV94234.1 MAG: glycerate kinase [Calditrichota bacterium]
MQVNFHKIATEITDRAIAAVDPYKLLIDQVALVRNRLTIKNIFSFDLDQFETIKLIGFGKGVAPMAAAMEEILDKRYSKGKIVVKYGHSLPLKKTEVFEASHPIPDANTLAATANILNFVDSLKEKDLVIVVISGGGSALFELLPRSIKLSDLDTLSRLLLASGANIGEINIIRKHISLVKGGRLAQKIAPANCICLILSDVIGDPVASISSGPTAPDPSTFDDAIEIVHRYKLESKIPKCILDYLQDGCDGKIPDTPKGNETLFERVHNIVVGNNRLALEKAKTVAEKHKLTTLLLTDRMEGEAREIAKFISAMIKSALRSGIPAASPGCVLMGGESIVKISGKGKGGRKQELALAVLDSMRDFDGPFYFSSIGTDGTDGPTDAAGAWIDHNSFRKAMSLNLNPNEYLEDNDAYHFFEKLGQLIKTGPTRTNVMDLAFFLI